MSNWKIEFGEDYNIPQEVLNLVNKGLLEDESWHNDAMPSFSTGAIKIWIDHPNRQERNLDHQDSNRYLVCVDALSEPGLRQDCWGNLYDGESIPEALYSMGFRSNEWHNEVETKDAKSLTSVRIGISNNSGVILHEGAVTETVAKMIVQILEMGNALGDDLE